MVDSPGACYFLAAVQARKVCLMVRAVLWDEAQREASWGALKCGLLKIRDTVGRVPSRDEGATEVAKRTLWTP